MVSDGCHGVLVAPKLMLLAVLLQLFWEIMFLPLVTGHGDKINYTLKYFEFE